MAKWLVFAALACGLTSAADPSSKPKRKWCNTTVHGFAGDYAYEACGSFCKEAKAMNHCKFCKCRACSFCAGKGSSLPKTSPAAGSSSASSPVEAGKSPSHRIHPNSKETAARGAMHSLRPSLLPLLEICSLTRRRPIRNGLLKKAKKQAKRAKAEAAATASVEDTGANGAKPRKAKKSKKKKE
eukprot:CAMPEP_0195611378 /NCGR_PEP_ID=MMETSP0815-20121206/10309_1 /TAXON_ID=97485 /ORGANISM="Prymnesium parvum, Strain Texoma1" /LENGTH=183 /DNA_ID=CAMNT_0040751427 /DNA_START=35 /DNA_END=586 /DNA_ORIENTATION=-